MTLETRKLGWSDEQVCAVALGCMTFGVQNDEAESHAIIDEYIRRCGRAGVLDAAEMYPVPSADKRWHPGRTEEILGTYFQKHPEQRGKCLVATKVMGFSPGSETAGNRKLTLGTGGARQESGLPSLEPGRLDRESVLEACEASLKRLQLETIDLYQVHSPDRYVPAFGAFGYNVAKERPDSVPIKETVGAMKTLLDEGKIKYYGLSNESPFGLMQWCAAADTLGCPRPVSVQNQYSLLLRVDEHHLAEAMSPSNLDVAYLPWTPLAGGLLTDKYLGADGKVLPKEEWPAGARHALFARFMDRFRSPLSVEAIEGYAAVARDEKCSLATLALKFCRSRWFATSTIMGATSLAQLKENLDAFEADEAPLSDEALRRIDELHLRCQNPIMSI